MLLGSQYQVSFQVQNPGCIWILSAECLLSCSLCTQMCCCSMKYLSDNSLDCVCFCNWWESGETLALLDMWHRYIWNNYLSNGLHTFLRSFETKTGFQFINGSKSQWTWWNIKKVMEPLIWSNFIPESTDSRQFRHTPKHWDIEGHTPPPLLFELAAANCSIRCRNATLSEVWCNLAQVGIKDRPSEELDGWIGLNYEIEGWKLIVSELGFLA